MSDDLLGKADRLMRRHRSFVVSASPAPAPAAADVNDDLPVLTEVVVTAGDQARRDENALQMRLAEHLARERALMVAEFERWLDEQLPQVVISAMDGVAEKLLALVAKRAQAELLPRLRALAAAAADAAGERADKPV